MREAKEEIGLNPRNVILLGSLDPAKTIKSNFFIHPIVGTLKEKQTLRGNPKEVEKIGNIIIIRTQKF